MHVVRRAFALELVDARKRPQHQVQLPQTVRVVEIEYKVIVHE